MDPALGPASYPGIAPFHSSRHPWFLVGIPDAFGFPRQRGSRDRESTEPEELAEVVWVLPSQSQTGVPCESRGRTERTNENLYSIYSERARGRLRSRVKRMSVYPNVRPVSLPVSSSRNRVSVSRPVPAVFMTCHIRNRNPLRVVATRGSANACRRWSHATSRKRQAGTRNWSARWCLIDESCDWRKTCIMRSVTADQDFGAAWCNIFSMPSRSVSFNDIVARRIKT